MVKRWLWLALLAAAALGGCKKKVEEEPEVVPPTMTSARSRGIWLCFDRPAEE